MENKMQIYDAVREAPNSAVKKITGGSYGAAGLSDINPQWRIETMTKLFGPVGFGWTWEPVECFDRDGVLYAHVIVKYADAQTGEWSKDIHGYGGTKFGGRDDSDVYKSTMTDAVSNALRYLGVGADVWYNAKKEADENQFDTKYSAPAQKAEQAQNAGLTSTQIVKMKAMLQPDEWEAMQDKYGVGLARMAPGIYETVFNKIRQSKKKDGAANE